MMLKSVAVNGRGTDSLSIPLPSSSKPHTTPIYLSPTIPIIPIPSTKSQPLFLKSATALYIKYVPLSPAHQKQDITPSPGAESPPQNQFVVICDSLFCAMPYYSWCCNDLFFHGRDIFGVVDCEGEWIKARDILCPARLVQVTRLAFYDLNQWEIMEVS